MPTPIQFRPRPFPCLQSLSYADLLSFPYISWGLLLAKESGLWRTYIAELCHTVFKLLHRVCVEKFMHSPLFIEQ